MVGMPDTTVVTSLVWRRDRSEKRTLQRLELCLIVRAKAFIHLASSLRSPSLFEREHKKRANVF